MKENLEIVGIGAGTTDDQGLYTFPVGGAAVYPRGYAIFVQGKDQQLAATSLIRGYAPPDPRKPQLQTIFFTDRSLYRPVQIIQYKGVCLRSDQEKDDYKVLAAESVTVVLIDVSGKEVARNVHRSNDYGSFSGSFTASRNHFAGRMCIRTELGPPGRVDVNIEEYKRPNFSVTLEALKTPAQLNGKVKVEGKATSYTGAPIGEGKVRYRVVREVRYPIWWGRCFWWRPVPSTPDQEIAHGTTNTRGDGGFTVEFEAKPDLSISESEEPSFRYTVYADITDSTGETRSASKSITVGYTALKANLTSSEWTTSLKPVELNVLTQNLDDVGQAADGIIKVYALKQPEQVKRESFHGDDLMPFRTVKEENVKPDPSNPESWELGKVVGESRFTSDGDGKVVVGFNLKEGVYRALLETKDRFGKKVTARVTLMVLNPEAGVFPIRVANHVVAEKWSVEPGEEFKLVWGTGYERGRAFVEVEHQDKVIQSFWTDKDVTQKKIIQAVTEGMRGGFSVYITMVRENRGYLTARKVEVPWSNKKLEIRWERFVSKLDPARSERWTAVVTGSDAKKRVAELVAGLYDQSLDAYLKHDWMITWNLFRQDWVRRSATFKNTALDFNAIYSGLEPDYKTVNLQYRGFPNDILGSLYILGSLFDSLGIDYAERRSRAMLNELSRDLGNSSKGRALKTIDQSPFSSSWMDLVPARKNLNETAFFFPHLIAREDGSVAMEFTMPEALTTWRFMAFAHDKDLSHGFLEDTAVTSKDIMVQPNPPRFLREGDQLEFTAKVSNQSPASQSGKVRLVLTEARTGKSVDVAFQNIKVEQAFDIPANESRNYSWKLQVPDGSEPLIYKVVGSTGKLSDGEEGFLPVLSRRTLVSESLPLPIRGKTVKNFEFKRLIDSSKSNTLKSENLVVQMVSNPAWYAVMALPYLMEYPHGCSEQAFNRLYANAMARHIAASNPKIRHIFDQWKGTPALDSPLEKNQDLKSVMLEETPWLQQGADESPARRNVGILFDDNRLREETERVFQKLSQMQLEDGSWPWFPGGAWG